MNNVQRQNQRKIHSNSKIPFLTNFFFKRAKTLIFSTGMSNWILTYKTSGIMINMTSL